MACDGASGEVLAASAASVLIAKFVDIYGKLGTNFAI
jgi:hypothetical protein